MRLTSKKKMREKMLRLVELIPKKKSVFLAQKEMDYRDMDRLMEQFAQLGLSPVTIPKRVGQKHLDSLYSYL